MQNSIKLNVRRSKQTKHKKDLRKFLENTVVSHYKKYGYKDTAGVYFDDHLAVICIKMNPDMTDGFWEVLSKKVTPVMVERGYKMLKPIKRYGYVDLHYVRVPKMNFN